MTFADQYKTIAWTFACAIVYGCNKFFGAHLPQGLLFGLMLVGFSYLRKYTDKPLTPGGHIAVHAMSALVAVGTVLFYMLPATPPPASPNMPTVAAPAAVLPAPPASLETATPVQAPATDATQPTALPALKTDVDVRPIVQEPPANVPPVIPANTLQQSANPLPK